MLFFGIGKDSLNGFLAFGIKIFSCPPFIVMGRL